MYEDNNILFSLSDYANYLKQKVNESLFKQNNNNLNKISPNTQLSNNDIITSVIEIEKINQI